LDLLGIFITILPDRFAFLRGYFMSQPKVGRTLIVLLLTAFTVNPLRADDSAKSPEEIFKSKGLIKTGFMLIVPQEKDLHDAATVLRAAKGKLTAAAAKIRENDTQLVSVARTLKGMDDEMHDINVRLAKGEKDLPLLGRHDALAAEIVEELGKADDLFDARQKLLVSRSDYITAALDASSKADAALHAYDAPHADKDLAAAIDKFNLTAKPKVKLGPSAYFNEDLELVKKCKADVTSGTLQISTEGGVPRVEVLLNGTFNQTFIWDSGCTGVSLSAKTANALGLRPLPTDPIVESSIADGSRIQEHIKYLDSIRIGGFTVEHVACTIPPNGSRGVDLLGNEFQHHFQFKLDINNGTLQLTPLDEQSATIAKLPASSGSPPPRQLPAPSQPPVSSKTGLELSKVNWIVNTGTGDYLSAFAENKNMGNVVRIYPANNSDSEKWSFHPIAGSDVLNIVNEFSDQRLVVYQGSKKPGYEVIEWDALKPGEAYDKPRNSNWKIEPVGDSFKIVNELSGLCMTQRPGKEKITQEIWTGSDQQLWQIKPVDADAKADKPVAGNSIDRLCGVWFLPKNNSQYALKIDGTASAPDGNTGVWTVNTDNTVINIKWTKGGGTETLRLSGGKWTKYTYQDGTLKFTDEISPP
jgi:hypothetical protein